MHHSLNHHRHLCHPSCSTELEAQHCPSRASGPGLSATPHQELTATALADLCAQHPYLCSEGGTERRPVLPNLIDGNLYVGHQGHALCIAEWAHLVPLGGVFNLAADHVDIGPARAVTAAKEAI